MRFQTHKNASFAFLRRRRNVVKPCPIAVGRSSLESDQCHAKRMGSASGGSSDSITPKKAALFFEEMTHATPAFF